MDHEKVLAIKNLKLLQLILLRPEINSIMYLQMIIYIKFYFQIRPLKTQWVFKFLQLKKNINCQGKIFVIALIGLTTNRENNHVIR